jgi:hypothetical protein
VTAGFHRVAWDLRYPAADPVNLEPSTPRPWSEAPSGPMVVPGRYSVSIAKRVRGEVTPLGQSQTFETVPLGTASLPAGDREELLAFQRQTARLQRAVLGSVRAVGEAQNRITHIKRALDDTPGADPSLAERARKIEMQLADLLVELSGDRTIRRRSEPTPPSIEERVQRIVGGQWASTSAPTQTNRDAYRYASELFRPVLSNLTRLIEVDLAQLELEMDSAGAPWTPGRVPRWSAE